METFDLLGYSLDPGVTLIEASAGTGKTYNIQHLYLRFVVEQNLTPEQILVVTFSQEATAELKQRIIGNLTLAEEMLAQYGSALLDAKPLAGVDCNLTALLARALQNTPYPEVRRRVMFAARAMDEAAIMTIHGFCLSVLTDYAFESNSLFGVDIVGSRHGLFADLVNDFVRGYLAETPGLKGILQREYVDIERLSQIVPLIYGRDDVRTVAEREELPDILALYKSLLFEDFSALRAALKKKRGTKAYPLIDFLESCPEPTSEDLSSFLQIVNGAAVGDMIKYSRKYYVEVFHQEFQEVVRRLRTVPERVMLNTCLDFIDYIHEYYSTSQTAEERTSLVFDDLLYRTRAALKGEGRRLVRLVGAAYSAVIVDEFQDTSGVQFDIFDTLFGGGKTPFMMIGDPKQSIYAFRGADIFSYLQAVKTPKVRRATLRQNYRSTPEYIAAMNLLFANRTAEDGRALPFGFEEIKYIEITPGREDTRRLYAAGVMETPLEVRWREGNEALDPRLAEKEIVSSVADDIAIKLNMSGAEELYFGCGEVKDSLKPSDIAVLVVQNRQGELVREELNRRGIVGVLLKSGSVLATHEASELGIVLKAILNPRSQGALLAALSTRCFAYTLAELNELSIASTRILDYWQLFFTEVEQGLRHVGFLYACSLFLEREHTGVGRPSVKVALALMESGERVLTNYLQLVEILEQELIARGLSDSAVVELLEELIKDDTGNVEHEMRLESDEDAVKIMTIHKSKGLEFPLVYVPFAFTPIKDYSRFSRPLTCYLEEGGLGLLLSASDLKNWSGRLRLQERAENMRLFYVALTRAVDKCILYGGIINGIERSVLADIFDQDFSRLVTLADSPYISLICEWEDTQTRYISQAGRVDLALPEFSGRIERDWGVMSYSSLVQHEFVNDDVRRDASFVDETADVIPESIVDNLAPLPSSNTVGSAIHELIEQGDFSTFAQGQEHGVIFTCLQKYGVFRGNTTLKDVGSELTAVARLLALLAKLELRGESATSFNLEMIKPGKQVAELSFYFPVRRKISTERLYDFFHQRGLRNYRKHAEFSELLAGLNLTLKNKGFREGFLYGLIDLVFEHEGKFYFADWKTNNLARYGGYNGQAVLSSMGESGYLLQFYIYTVALNLFLRSRIPDFSYSRHFGGGYYLYLRGLELERPESGVFFDRPREEDVTELLKIFTGETNGE